jgi:hypothetical protein
VQYDPSNLAHCFNLTVILVAIWAVLSAAEWIANAPLFHANGLLSWDVVSLRYGRANRSAIATKIASAGGCLWMVRIRLAAGLTLLFLPPSAIQAVALSLILLSCTYLTHRTCFGGDGSDQMGAIITAGCLLGVLGKLAVDPDLARSGAFLIAGQATISYFVAGAAKVVSKTWRSGHALVGVMSTQTYGHVTAARIAIAVPGFAALFCWTVILMEMAFPALLFAPDNFLIVGLLGFAAFHLSNGVFMGLNTFIPTFLGTYPSILYMNSVLRGIVF